VAPSFAPTHRTDSPFDLVACDESQVAIERSFRRYNRFYLRRAGQKPIGLGPRAGTPISSRDLAKVLATCHQALGPTVAAASIDALFDEDRHYKTIFGTTPHQEMLAKWILHEHVAHARRTMPRHLRRRLRYCERNVLAATWRLIEEDADLRDEAFKIDRFSKLVPNAAHEGREYLRTLRSMFRFAWSLFSRTSGRQAGQFFFKDRASAQRVTARIERRFRRQLSAAARSAMLA